ncbi:hypothetical protein HDV00_000238 [Rhizophlyctis rosea]|nr:hypothetical protein HDV00_000238 [Rhizophlyctis rosea]
MYSPQAIPNNAVEADELYVQKLRNAINEMSLVKETAIRTENYSLADQTRNKIMALQAQLMKMEHQLNADVITNCVTRWLEDLAAWMVGNLGKTGIRHFPLATTPHHEPFHTHFISIIRAIPPCYYDSLIRSLLLILPQDIPDMPRSPYGYESFLRKLPSGAVRNSEALEWVKLQMTFSVLDALTYVTKFIVPQTENFSRETLVLVIRHAFYYLRAAASRRVIDQSVFDLVMMRWAIVLGDVAIVERPMIIEQVGHILDVTRKSSPEEIVTMLSATRYISAQPTSEKSSQTLLTHLTHLLSHIDKTKKPQLRIACIHALERSIQPLDFTPSQKILQPWESTLLAFLKDLHKKAQRWVIQSEELRPATMKLLAVLLVNMPGYYFAQQVDIYITSDLAPRPKLKSYVYGCLLQLLSGRFYADTKTRARALVEGSASTSNHDGNDAASIREVGGDVGRFAYLTRPVGEEGYDVMTARVKEIADILFVKRKGPIGVENLDTVVGVVVQMAVHNLQISLKLISHLLETRNTDTSIEIFYIGTRSLRIILDPDSGFSSPASAATRDPNFQYLLSEIPFEFEGSLSQMLHVCDQFAGVDVLGRSGRVVDIAPRVRRSGQSGEESGGSESKGRDSLGVVGADESGVFDGFGSGKEDVEAEREAHLREAEARGSVDGLVEKLAQQVGEKDGRAGENLGVGRASLESRRPQSGSTGVETLGRAVGSTLSRSGGGATLQRKGTANGDSTPTSPSVPSNAQTNAKVARAITHWLEACSLPTSPSDISRLILSSPLVEANWSARQGKLKLDTNQMVVLRLFKEVIRIVPFMPAPELVSGQWFIGAYLVHAHEEVAREVGWTLGRIFEEVGEMRLSIINGFLNYLKTTPYQDDISLCTVLIHLAHLINLWSTTLGPRTADSIDTQDRDIVHRVSCKLDAAMMVFLARPNSRIRKTCLDILEAFCGIMEWMGSFDDDVAGENGGATPLPLHAILMRTEPIVTKHALYAFLENDLFGHLLTPAVTCGLDTLSIRMVAESDYTVLWRFYLGECARQFSHYGRAKAVRHAAKFLRSVGVPYMTSLEGVTPEFVGTYVAYLGILMGLGGVPEVSEVEYTQQPQNRCDQLLFNEFKDFLAPILNSDNQWEIKAVVSASYFVHRSIVQLYVHSLWEWYDSYRATQRFHPRMLAHCITTLRAITQTPDFEYLIQEASVLPQGRTIVDVVTDFLQEAGEGLSDVGFLMNGPVGRVKMATDYCVIVQRVCEGLQSERMRRWREEGGSVEGGKEGGEGGKEADPKPIPEARWGVEVRRGIVANLKEWYGIVEEVGGVGVVSPGASGGATAAEREKLAHYRGRLVEKIGMAAEKILVLGDVFGAGDETGGGARNVGTDTLNWLVGLEAAGYKVITPEMLYNYENVLGTVLAQAYSGRSPRPTTFIDPIFEQVLPRVSRGPQLFLSGADTRITTSESYVSSLHALPPRADGENAFGEEGDEHANMLIYPLIDEDAAIKLRQNMGSLIFFGCYNMLHIEKRIRTRAFLFIRELFLNFNPDPNFDVSTFFAKHTGAFYSSVASVLRPRVLEISSVAADLFPGDAPSFLWEAVRASRSAAKTGGERASMMLVPGQQWVLEVIVPWCRYIDLTCGGGPDLDKQSEDMVNVEVFRFLMDAAFYRPPPRGAEEHVATCWEEMMRSNEFGEGNASVVTDVLVAICGRIDLLRDLSVGLLTKVFAVHPERVVSGLVWHLGSGAFPWKRRTGSGELEAGQEDAKPWTPVVRDYINVLCTALSGEAGADVPTPAPGSEYTKSCKSAVMLVSELLVQEFGRVAAHLPVLLNYVMLHLPMRLQENSVSTYLLHALVEGYIAMLHSEARVGELEGEGDEGEKLRRLLVLIDTATCHIDWESDRISGTAPALEDRFIRVPIAEFLEMLLSIFGKEHGNLRTDFAAEALNWATEGYLGPDHAVRAIETYALLISPSTHPRSASTLPMQLTTPSRVSNASMPHPHPGNLNALTSRLYDNVAVLMSVEGEIVRNGDEGGGWAGLAEGKRGVVKSTERVLVGILKLHQILIVLHGKSGTLVDEAILFWAAVSLLNLPAQQFPTLYSLALDNCRLYLTTVPSEPSSFGQDSPFQRQFEALSNPPTGTFSGLQPLLLQGLFPLPTDDVKLSERMRGIQEKAFDLLLTSWTVLPEYMVDPSPASLVYMVLYSLVWLFVRMDEVANGESGEGGLVAVENIASQLKDALTLKRPYEFTGTIRCLQTLTDTDADTPFNFSASLQQSGQNPAQSFTTDLLEKCTANIFQLFIPDYATNLSDFFSQAMQMGPAYTRTVIKMIRVLWSLGGGGSGGNGRRLGGLGGLKGLVKKVMFLEGDGGYDGEIEDLVGFVVGGGDGPGSEEDGMREVDLTSQGRVEGLPEVEVPIGAVR